MQRRWVRNELSRSLFIVRRRYWRTFQMKTHSVNVARFLELWSTGPQCLNLNPEIRKILKSKSLDRRLSWCSCESVKCQVCLCGPTGQKRFCSLLIIFRLCYFVTLGKKRSIYSLHLSHLVRIIIDYTMEILMCLITGGCLRPRWGCYILLRYIHGITFLKSETILKQFWSQDFRIKDLNAKFYNPVVKLTKPNFTVE